MLDASCCGVSTPTVGNRPYPYRGRKPPRVYLRSLQPHEHPFRRWPHKEPQAREYRNAWGPRQLSGTQYKTRCPAHHSTQYRTLLSRSLINVDVAGGNNAGCWRATRGAVRPKRSKRSGQERQLLECLRDRGANFLLSAPSSSHSTAERRMKSDLVNCMPPATSPPHVEQVARSSMLRNNKVSPWPRKTVRPLFSCSKRQMTRTRSNIRPRSDVIVSTALQII